MKELKAIFTMVGGTIGVGFLALPYAIYHFGIAGSVLVICAVAIITIITNIAYGDIVVYDKGNRQIPGYMKKYFGSIPAHILTFIIVFGSFGALHAYSLIAGGSLKSIFSELNINFSSDFWGLCFVIAGLIVMKYGMKTISKVSSIGTVALLLIVLFIIVSLFDSVKSENITSLNFDNFSLVFGISVFAFFSATSVPTIDEIIGYDKRKYRAILIISVVITLIFYLFFGISMSLFFGRKITSDLIGSFSYSERYYLIGLGVAILLATFTSFVIVSNSIKEIFCYDYKVSKRIVLLFIFSVCVWLLALKMFDFDAIISIVGRFSLALESIAIFSLWYKVIRTSNFLLKSLVFICGLSLLIASML